MLLTVHRDWAPIGADRFYYLVRNGFFDGARFFRVQQKARQTFGSEERAMQWLKRSTRPLNDHAPVALLDTDEGARLVEDLLTRIDHGIAA